MGSREKENAENPRGSPQAGLLFDLEFSYTDRQIAQLLLEANAPVEIAAQLDLPRHIVCSHLSALYRAFNIPNGQSHNRMVLLALRIHEQRAILGIRCQACGEK